MHFHECKCSMTGAHMYVSDERIWAGGIYKQAHERSQSETERERDLFSIIDSHLPC